VERHLFPALARRFGLIIWGFGLARHDPVVLWTPPVAMRHVAALLTLIAFVLLAAAYVPRNAIKARVHHPMVLAVKVWAFAHLLANGRLADLLLFGAFPRLGRGLLHRRAQTRPGGGHAISVGTAGAPRGHRGGRHSGLGSRLPSGCTPR